MLYPYYSPGEQRMIVEMVNGEQFKRWYLPKKWVAVHVRKMRRLGWKPVAAYGEYMETGTDDD